MHADARAEALFDPGPAAAYRLHQREVYGWAYRILGRHHDAMDVMQDVFIRWLRKSCETGPISARAWLRQVTINRSIDVCRARRTRAEQSEIDSSRATLSDDGTADALDLDALRRDIAAGLEGLSGLQRSVLIAKVYDEMTFAAIAEEFGISLPTAKTHYLRAVRAIRDRLRPRWNDDEESTS